MKKTLLICDAYPLPERLASDMRTMNFVRFFQNYGTVDVAYTNVVPGERAENPAFSNEYHLQKKVYPPTFHKRLLMFIKRVPYPIKEYHAVSKKQLLSLIQSNDYDYILVRYIWNAIGPLKLTAKYKMRTIIDFDDLLSGSLYEARFFYSTKRLYKKFIRSLNRKLLINYEKRCLNFGASLFCSEIDSNKMKGESNTNNTFVVPNIYHNKSFENYNFGNGLQNGNTLLFVGGMTYAPNIDGLKWFIESFYDDFKRSFSDAKLLVVGRSPSDEIKKLCGSKDGIELYGDVPDVKKYYKQCTAVIVPLLAGGGTRIKILEAALANRPVLSTPIGAEGLDFTDETNILLFENANEFLTKYIKILNKDKYNELVHNANKYVSNKFSEKNFNDAMEKVLNELNQQTSNMNS